jgi:uncharacterized protein YceK
MNRIIFSLIVIVPALLISSCSSVNKHKSSVSIHADSTSHEATSLVTAQQETAKAKYVSADTAVKTGNELTNTKTETSYIFQEIPADAVLNNTKADDYFPASYKTKDGRQFIAVPVLKKEENKKKEWLESKGSSKSVETEINKKDSSSGTTVKDTKNANDITIKESAKKKIQFSFWWIVLIVAAGLVWYYRKPIIAFIKKAVPGI